MKEMCAHKLAGGTYTSTVLCGKTARPRLVCPDSIELHYLAVCGTHERFWTVRGFKAELLKVER